MDNKSVESGASTNRNQEKKESSAIVNAIPLVVKNYFGTIVKDDGNFIEAQCDLCKPSKKTIRGQYKAPSNFTKHIKVNYY